MTRRPAAVGLLAVVTLAAAPAKATAQQQDPLRAHHERAQSFQLAGELDRAEAEYRTEVLPRALRRLGNLSGAEGRAGEAIALLEEAARLAPADVDIQIDLAVACLRKGDVARADNLAKATVSAAPSNARARSVFGKTRLLAGDAAQAATELRKSLDQEARFDTAFALAFASLRLGRVEAARALFDQMTVSNTTAELLVLIGRAYLESADLTRAAEHFTLAWKRNPSVRAARYYLGLTHLAGAAPDRASNARAQFEAELQVTPDHSRAKAALESLAQGRTPSVAGERRVLLDLLPTATAADAERRRDMRAQLAAVLESSWHNLAVIHAKRGNAEAAAAASRTADRWRVRDDRTPTSAVDVDVPIASAEKLVQAGDLDGAERAVAPVLEQQPELPAALRVLGLIRAAQGRYDEAEALLRRASDQDASEHGALVTLARVYVSRGEFARALEALDRAPASLQQVTSAVRARAHLGLGEIEQARVLLADVGQRATADEAAAVVEALVARDLSAEARALIEAVRARNESSAPLLLASARLALHTNDPAAAEASLEQALALDPGTPQALQLLAAIASDAGDDARAADLLQRASERAPDSPQLLRQLAEAAGRAARLEEALTAARRLATIRPEDADARRLLAVALLQNQNWREAIEILASPPPGRARDPEWALALGMAHFGRRDYEAARSAFERALQVDSGQIEARYHLGLIAREQGRTAEALDALSAVVATDPSHSSARLELGTLYLAKGDVGRAQRHLECAAVLNPDDPAPHYQLGLLFRRTGDLERARKEMQQFEENRHKSLSGSPDGVVKRRSRKGGC